MSHDTDFTGDEAACLAGHFSNTGRSIFVITTPNQADRGALMSRYSRSSKSMRRVFLDEFLGNPGRGEAFYERVLAGYGDDSVAELGTAQVAMEGLSNIVTQKVEDRRIGLSFLEKSSRYVPWNAKHDGRYAYYRGPDIMESRHEKLYEESCDLSFDTYTYCLPRVRSYVMEANPVEGFQFVDSESGRSVPFPKLTIQDDIRAAERAYANSVKAATLDLLRGLLPASTLTNLGVAGNGRAFEYLISVLRSSTLHEERDTGDRLAAELKRMMGPFTRRADGEYGRQMEEYLAATGKSAGAWSAKAWSAKMWPDAPAASDAGTHLVSCSKRQDALDMVVTGLCYGESARMFDELRHLVADMTVQQKADMISRAAGLRNNRRQRPPRAFELASYMFDMEHNYGMFRDMHRHRLLTMLRQPLNTTHGFDMPPELEEAGCSAEFVECLKRSDAVYRQMAATDRMTAQYVVNFAYRCRYVVCVNLRELCHMVELRSMPQGHSDYRRVARSMYEQVRRVHPELSQIIKFVNTDEYTMGRIDSERRAATKAAAGQ